MENLLIRRATSEDLDSILQLNSQLFREEYENYDKTLKLAWPQTIGRDYFLKRVSGQNGVALVAHDGRGVIGYLCGGVSKQPSYRNKGVYCELENMLVDEKYRGKGVGMALVKEFIQWTKEQGAVCVSVTASAENKHGVDFYQACGFKNYSITLEMQ